MNHIVSRDCVAHQGLSVTAKIRFWKYVNRNGQVQPHCPELGPCWDWEGYKYPNKYGGFYGGQGGTRYAHIASWIIHYGPVPKSQCVLHKCDNPSCVNPDHLFLGTNKENTQDMIAKGRMRIGDHSGEHNPNASVTWDIVRQIRARHVPWHVTKKTAC